MTNEPSTSTPTDAEEVIDDMDLFGHLVELRKRVFVSAVAIAIASTCTFIYSTIVFDLLAQPFADAFEGHRLIGTGPAEAFVLRLKVAIFSGAIIASPVLFYQVWLFVVPGLYEEEKKLALPFILGTTGLFLLGVMFCFFVVLPFAFEFFRTQYEAIDVNPTIRITEHISIIIKAVLGFGIVFEMPILAYFLGRVGLITDKLLKDTRRYAIVTIFVVSAILTPPDVLTQFLMVGPLVGLYELSIIIVKLTGRDKEEPEKESPTA